MERLLRDAEKISGVKYDISSYADIVDAIHVVQTEMHISGLTAEEAAEKVRNGEMTQEEAFAAMGTTAKEASTTIQGSLNSAKAAWQNLVVGLSDENSNIDKLINNFFDSIVTVGDNIIPRIGVVLNGITGMIEKLAPKITEKIPSIVEQVLPSIVKGATSLLTAVLNILPELSKTAVTLLPTILESIGTVFKGIVDSLPVFIQTIVSALPSLIPQVISGIIGMWSYLLANLTVIIQPILDKLPDILISITNALMDNLPTLIDGVIQMTLGLVNALPRVILSLLDALPTIIEKVISGLLGCLPQLIEGAITLVLRLVEHLPEIILGLIKAIPKVFQTIVDTLLSMGPKLWGALTKIFSDAWVKVQEIFGKIPEWFSTIFNEAWKGVKSIWNSAGKFFSGIWDGIKSAFSAVGKFFSNIFKGAVDGIKGAFDGVKLWFENLWKGICRIIKAPINWMIDGINGIIGGLNSLKIDIPDWVPFVGGQTWGLNIPKIPKLKLARGGIVESGTAFIAGEAGAEAVIPLENNTQWISKFARTFAEEIDSFYSGNNVTNVQDRGRNNKLVNINLYLDNVNVKNEDDIPYVAERVSELIAQKLVVEGMAAG